MRLLPTPWRAVDDRTEVLDAESGQRCVAHRILEPPDMAVLLVGDLGESRLLFPLDPDAHALRVLPDATTEAEALAMLRAEFGYQTIQDWHDE